MEYIAVLDNLKMSINDKGLTSLFLESIKDLKNIFGQDVSTKFLRSLSELSDSRKKTRRINYLMRKCKLKTERVYRFYDVRGVSPHNVEVREWGHDERVTPFNENEGLTYREAEQLRQIKEIGKETGIYLFPHAEAKAIDRQKTRHAFNYSGGAVVRDVKVVRCGDYRIIQQREVLHMVVLN